MKRKDTWEGHLRRQSQSGLSIKAYCAKNKITYSLFFYHQRRLRSGDQVKGFQEVKLVDSDKQAQNKPGVYQLEFPQGHVLSFPEHLLEHVIKLLHA